MRFVTYNVGGETALGVRTPDGIVATGHSGLRGYLDGGPEAAKELSESLRDSPVVQPDRLLAPLAERCQLIFCGGNYREHLREVGLSPAEPVFFPKLWSSVAHPGQPVIKHTPATKLDYEVEFAVVIGRTARHVRAEEAMDYVFGFTVVNDFSARDVMEREPLQIMLCKSADRFCPVAEDIVTPDEVDLAGAAITCRVNGELRQDATLDDMIYTLPHILEFLTRTVTLSPGDLVTTGTPGGVALGRTLEAFLQPGDVVEAAVAGVGTVTSTIEAGW